jgi:retron-type reverse transcriptase
VIEVGSSSLNEEMGLPQGSILSPVLFNIYIYLEEALNSSEKLRMVRKRDELLAFANEMLVMTSDRGELEHIVNELSSLLEKI